MIKKGGLNYKRSCAEPEWVSKYAAFGLGLPLEKALTLMLLLALPSYVSDNAPLLAEDEYNER